MVSANDRRLVLLPPTFAKLASWLAWQQEITTEYLDCSDNVVVFVLDYDHVDAAEWRR